jgi:beta-lactamase regulating signal transducer with metallopeptidase domain
MMLDKGITVISFLLNISLKGGLFIIICLAAYALARGFSPRFRHAILLLAAASFILIPVVSWVVNVILIFITTDHMANSVNVFAAPVLDTMKRGFIELPRQVDVTALLQPSGQTVGGPHWSIWVMLIWGIGAVGGLVRILVGKISLRHLNRTSGFEDERLMGFMQKVKRKMGITRRVRLSISRSYSQPAAFSWRRPVVLLPAQARSWPIKQLEAVFTHELTHIRQWDCLTRDLARVICALFWFIPFTWIVYARLKNEQEKICDQNVILHGARPADYAEQLLHLAKENMLKRVFAHAFIPMVERKVLRSRIEFILKMRNIFNANATGRLLPALLLCALVLMVPFSVVNPVVITSDTDILAELKNTVTLDNSMDISHLPYEIKSNLKAFPVVWPVLEGLGQAESGRFINDNQSMRIELRKWDYGVVVAVADGVIEDINNRFNNMYEIVIRHKNNIQSVYSLVEPCENIQVGDSVCQGDLVGYFVMNKMKNDTYFSSMQYKKYIDFALKTDSTYINPLQALLTFNKRLYMKY